MIGFDDLVWLNEEYGNRVYQPQCGIDDVYIWGNNLGGADVIGYNYNPLGGDVYLRAPSLAEDGFTYP